METSRQSLTPGRLDAFPAYLQGMETALALVYEPKHQCSQPTYKEWKLAYRNGVPFTAESSQPTYKEWKQVSPNSKISLLRVPSLPTRNGNAFGGSGTKF